MEVEEEVLDLLVMDSPDPEEEEEEADRPSESERDEVDAQQVLAGLNQPPGRDDRNTIDLTTSSPAPPSPPSGFGTQTQRDIQAVGLSKGVDFPREVLRARRLSGEEDDE